MSELKPTGLTPSPADKRRQKTRSIAIAGALVFLAVLFYLITIFKMGASILNKGI
jgi:hypothetical protein